MSQKQEKKKEHYGYKKQKWIEKEGKFSSNNSNSSKLNSS